MRRILFLMMLLLAGNGIAANVGEFSDYREIRLIASDDDVRNVKHEKTQIDPEDTPATRGLICQAAYAYICNNNVVTVTFGEVFSAATVTVTNESTGETVYSEAHSNPATLAIDLNGESYGDYLIEIEADDTYLQGTFSL